MSQLFRRLALTATCTLLAARADAQGTLHEHLDAARLRAGTDSFVVLLQGAPRGWQRLTVARDGDGWRLGDAITIDSLVSQRSDVLLDAGLRERRLRQEGVMRGRPMRIALDFADGRVAGRALTPSAPAELAIDTTVTAQTVDDNAIAPLLAAVRWQAGLEIATPVLASGRGTIETHTLRVTGEERVTVPAGTFDTWRIEHRAGRSLVVAHVTRAAPYRVVRLSNGPAFTMELVEATPR